MIKKWFQGLRIRENVGVDILETALSLGYLPHYLFRDGVDIVTIMADNSGNQDLQAFAGYVRRYWLPLGKIVSVFGVSLRTNNTCELFHRNAHRVLHDHPEFFQFLSIYYTYKST